MVEHALRRAGIGHYCPIELWEVVHWKTKKKILHRRPLLQGWIFLADITDWPAIERIPEILGPIRSFDQTPMPIRSEEVERIQEAEGSIRRAFEEMRRNRAMTRDRVAAMYPSGSVANIVHGPFKGQQIRIEAAASRRTVKAVLEMLGGSVPMEINITDLEAAQ